MFKKVDILSWTVAIQEDANGIVRVRPTTELGPYPPTLTAVLDHWATAAPHRTFLAKRSPTGDWRRLTYSELRTQALDVAQWLLDAGLTAERPIAILSGNDLEHAIMAMAALYAGIPYAPISPAYSLISSGNYAKLRHVIELLNPGLIFASDQHLYGPAIDAVANGSLVLTTIRHTPYRGFSSAAAPDSIAKILFTSGSTGMPKGVINTHRMLCSNQEMLRTVFPFFANQPLVVCDWLPWNHTFGGNHNFGLVLYNGGTLYIDDGRPVNRGFAETIRNLKEIAPTVYFNVPKGYETLAAALRHDAGLRKHFFSRLSMMFYAAAGLSQHIWDALDELAIAECGQRISMLTGLGATETAPFAICANPHTARSGVVGLPVPGVELKLVPTAGKLEARLRGPNVTPGFWRQPELTKAAFDVEGFFCLGDALRFLDPENKAKGFMFDGRIAEDFKLSTGTWVSVGPLKARFILHSAPHVRDIVVAGHDRDELTALIFPDADHPPTREQMETLLRTFASQSTGSSTRIARALLLVEPPSLDAGEVTDKGSINQRAVLERRAPLVGQLYQTPPPAQVICL